MVWVMFVVVEIVEYGKVSNSTRKKREADRHFMRKFVELTRTTRLLFLNQRSSCFFTAKPYHTK